MATVAIRRAWLVMMMEQLFVDLDAIEWDSSRQQSWSLKESACQGFSCYKQYRRRSEGKNEQNTYNLVHTMLFLGPWGQRLPSRLVQFDKLWRNDERFWIGDLFPSLNCWQLLTPSRVVDKSRTNRLSIHLQAITLFGKRNLLSPRFIFL